MIRSIWNSWADIPNTLHAEGIMGTNYFVSFILFWVCSLPLLYPPVHKIRHFFTVKSYTAPLAGIAFFIWAIVRAGGLGPIIHQPTNLHGSALAWAVIKGIMSSIANFATLIVNDADFARFARKSRDAIYSQMLTIPIGFAITSFIGIIVSSSAVVIFGEKIWNPLEILGMFLDRGGAGPRAGVFLIATAFTLVRNTHTVLGQKLSDCERGPYPRLSSECFCHITVPCTQAPC